MSSASLCCVTVREVLDYYSSRTSSYSSEYKPNCCRRYQHPNLAISTLYWKAWLLLLVVAAFNPQKIGMTHHLQVSVKSSHAGLHNCVFSCLYLHIPLCFVRLGSLGWLSHTENAHGNGHDQVSMLKLTSLNSKYQSSPE